MHAVGVLIVAILVALDTGERDRPRPAQPEHEPREEPSVRGSQRGCAELRHGHRVREDRGPRVRAGRVVSQRAPDRGHHEPAALRDRRGVRLRRHPGRRAGVPAGRQARPRLRRLYVGHVWRRHLRLLPRGRGARLRRPQGGRHRQERHVHRRADQPARALDGLLRGGRAGLPQPHDPPERAVPLQLELRPDHLVPAGNRDLRHRELRRAGEGRRARAADAAGARHRVARHHLLRRRRPGLLGRPLSGRGDRHHRPGRPEHRLELARPGHQRVAPGRPVLGRRARLRARGGRVRGRRRRAGLPERRLPHLRGHGSARAGAEEGRLLEHRRRRPDEQPRGHLHRARVRHPRAPAAHDGRLLQRRRAGRGPLRAPRWRGPEAGRLLQDGECRLVVGQDAQDRAQRLLLPVRERHRAGPGRVPLRRDRSGVGQPRHVARRGGRAEAPGRAPQPRRATSA